MRSIRLALLALFALAAAPAAAHAQAPAGEAATEAAAAAAEGTPTSAATSAPADAPSASAPASGSSLPRYTPPRTLRAYAHVFVAFALAWVLLFGYVVYLARKFRRVEEQVAALAGS